MNLLKKRKDDVKEFAELIDLGCGVETHDGVHYIISPSGEKVRELSEMLFNFLIERKVIELDPALNYSIDED